MMGEIEKMETKVKQFTKMGVCLWSSLGLLEDRTSKE
jgi:hypothetical protein